MPASRSSTPMPASRATRNATAGVAGWRRVTRSRRVSQALPARAGTTGSCPTRSKTSSRPWITSRAPTKTRSRGLSPKAGAIGTDRWKEIRRVEVGGKTVWVGRALFGSEDLVLDENGKLVRAKKIVEGAIAAARMAERVADDVARAERSSGGSSGHAWGPGGQRAHARRRPLKRRRASRGRALRGRYGRPAGWAGESERHATAARKGWLRRR